MSVSNQNVAYFGSGAPVAGGSTVLAFAGSSLLELAYQGQVTFTGDNSATTALVNFIDGTNALFYTPSVVAVTRVGGNAAASIVTYANVVNNICAQINWSAAPGTNSTSQYLVSIYK